MRSWKEQAWLCVDTETTGIGEDAKVVELGAVLSVDFEAWLARQQKVAQ